MSTRQQVIDFEKAVAQLMDQYEIDGVAGLIMTGEMMGGFRLHRSDAKESIKETTASLLQYLEYTLKKATGRPPDTQYKDVVVPGNSPNFGNTEN